MSDEDPTTQELRIEQLQREAAEQRRADTSIDANEADQHERRADKAGYLREKLEQRARSEREADDADDQG